MTLRGHIIKGPCDFMVRNSSLYVTNLSNLVVIVIVLVEITYLICQVTFQDHAIKGSCDFIEQSSLYVTILSDLVVIDIVIDETYF